MDDLFFNDADVQANFDPTDFERGRDYWRKGTVEDLMISDHGTCLTARVRGTASRPYKVSVHIVPPRALKSGGMSRPAMNGECSCPVSIGCKHAVAVCLEALAAQDHVRKDMTAILAAMPPHLRNTFRSSTQLPRTPPDPTETWLSGLAQSAVGPAEDVRPLKKAVLYILSIPLDHKRYIHHQAMLEPRIAPILKNGRFSDKTYAASVYQLTDGAGDDLTAADRMIGRLMRGANTYGSDLRSPPMDADFFDLILHHVVATGRCFLDKPLSDPLVPGDEKLATLGWHTDHDGAQIPALIADDDPARLVILPAARPWYVDTVTRQTGPLRFDAPLAMVHKFLEGPAIKPAAIAAVAKKMAARSFAVPVAIPRAVKIHKRVVAPTPCLRLLAFAPETNHTRKEEVADHPQHLALLHFDYDGVTVDPNEAPESLRRTDGDRVILMPRDRQAENQSVNQLFATAEGLTMPLTRPASVPRGRLVYALSGDARTHRARWLDFVHDGASALREAGWRVEIDADFATHFHAIEAEDTDEAWTADLKEQEGGAWWFSLDLGIMVEGQRVTLLPLLVQTLKRLPEVTPAAIESLAAHGKLYVDLPDGRALALPFRRVRDMLMTLIELYDQPLNADGTMTVPLDLAAALARIDAATRMRWLGGRRLQALVERLRHFDGLTPIAPPQGLVATLRPYQREGLNWLQFLRDYGLGGILADDMGLGKTVQALAHILTEKESGRLTAPCLIVCPTSLIPNWQDEATKFAPSLNVLALHGKERAARFDAVAGADLVLTTYPLLPRDAEILQPVDWHMVVLDEAQAIKNPSTKATQLVCELKAKHRLCLTGTPIENHLGEAWSHFAFLMPGMLGTHKDFTKRFRFPIEKQRDSDRQRLLAQRLKPFILRRNKADVAKELPPKTEIIHYVEFDSAQRDLYETVRLTMHDKVRQVVADKGFNRSRIVILDALLKLRQTCCDPRLLKLAGAKKAKRSAKLDSLMDMIPEMVEEGRRILLFSQFTSMLDLIKQELAKTAIPFVEIRGDTVDRKTPVVRFQRGEVPLFLISLKAGGTGLNLTAADTVIHYDPWWNPAVENQATDRAYRIGQDKPVFVYKFIAKGTVEERILDLQNRKRGLAAALLDERPDATAAFEATDIDFLFNEAA